MSTPENPFEAAASAQAGSSSSAPVAAPGTADGWNRVAEQFARDYLKDRRSERRWRIFFRLVWIAAIIAVVWAFVAQRNLAASASGPHTALIEVRGEIAADTEASAENLVAALKSAFEDPGARAVVLRFNSPGGSPVQAGIVNDEILRLKVLHKKKVYAVVEDTCASGAYYIAVAADEIYADKASIVGSIGVLMDGFGFTGTMEKAGVERRLLTAGDNKGMLDPFSPLNEKQVAYAQFIAVVKQGRGTRLKATPETFSGLFWNGEEAVKLGLADAFGNLDFVAREVVKAENVIDYTPQEHVAERLAKQFGASIGQGAVKALRQLAPIR